MAMPTRDKVMKVIAKATSTQRNSGTTFFRNSIDDAISSGLCQAHDHEQYTGLIG